jgi:hypothetical protein
VSRSDQVAIDLDEKVTWPGAALQLAEAHARRLVDSTEFVGDLDISLEQEDEFRKTFGGRGVLAYHCTRLLPHEVDRICMRGLRRLDERLVRDRIAGALAHGALPAGVLRRAQAGNIYAIRNERGRAGQICFIVGRSIFDEVNHGCVPFLRFWGGEAIRGGPGAAPELATIGTPSLVLAKLNLTTRHDDPYSRPGLAKLFVGSILGIDRLWSTVHYRQPIAADDVQGVWLPGHPKYDRHRGLPQ